MQKLTVVLTAACKAVHQCHVIHIMCTIALHSQTHHSPLLLHSYKLQMHCIQCSFHANPHNICTRYSIMARSHTLSNIKHVYKHLCVCVCAMQLWLEALQSTNTTLNSIKGTSFGTCLLESVLKPAAEQHPPVHRPKHSHMPHILLAT